MGESVNRYRSIITRLTLMVTGILVTAVLVVGSLALLGQYRQLHQFLGTKAASLAQFMAQVTPLSILSLNFVEMNNNAKKVVLTDDEALYAVILNEQRIPLVYFFKDTDPSVTGEVRDLVKNRKPLAAIEAMKRAGRILEVTAPISAGEKRIGSATLGFSTEKRRRALLRQIMLIGAILLVIIGLSIALLRAVLLRILHPVQALTTAANQISTGDLNVVLTGKDRADELGVLSRAFESMAGQLGGLIAGLERQLRFVETLLRTIPMAVFYKDTEGRYFGCNEEFTKITGVTKEDIAGKTVYELWPGELSETYHLQDLDLLKNPAIQVYDFKVSNYKGELLDVLYHKNVFLDEKGRVAGVIGAFLDITERKRAEEALKVSEERFRRLAENARDVIYRMSLPDGAYEYMSPAATDIFGYAPEEFYASPQLRYKVIHPDWHGYFEEKWSKLLRGDMPPTYEYQIIHKSGDVRWMNQRNILISDERGIIAIEGIVTDITERKKSEVELRKLNEELSTLNAELEQRVKQRTVELEEKNADLQKMNRIFVGRELRMAELKEKIKELEERLS
ncbi:MAG: PAS domain S-box protein [Geobacteraceae bacterium]|jgi:PAS domain S-box-containing protein